MSLKILQNELVSRAVRRSISEDETQVRLINPLKLLQSEEDESFLDTVLNIGKALVGFISGVLSAVFGFLKFSFSSLWGLIVSAGFAIANFNWNISDKDIDILIKNRWITFASQLGGTVGNSLGYFVCGIVPSVTAFTFNEALGTYLIQQIGPEFAEELAGNLTALIRQSIVSAATTAFAIQYRNIRKVLKNPKSPLRKIIPPNILNDWGAQDAPVVTIAESIEETIDSIPNPFARAFTEELLEEFFEGCIEAGFIISSGIDAWIAQQRVSEQFALGTERVVEMLPDRSNSDERVLLAGPESLVKPAIVSSLAEHELLFNRDLGQLVGDSAEDYIRRARFDRKLTVIFYSVPNPPYNRGLENPVKRVTINIPQPKRASIDWKKIKQACGGENGYKWGRFRANVKLSNGSQFHLYGATENEAEKRARALIDLSEAEVEIFNVSEELKADNRLKQPKLQKESTQVYPAYVTVSVQRKNLNSGHAGTDGNLRQRDSIRFDLWRKEEPPN